MNDILIFGNGKIADVIYYYATRECNFNVVAFTVDEKYILDERFHGLPVVPFDKVETIYNTYKYGMFIAIGYHDLNRLRESKCIEAKAKGFNLVSIVSPKTNLPQTVKYGENCFIMPPSVIHPEVVIGNNTFIWSGAMVGHHSIIGENCWLTSCTNISGVVTTGSNCFFAVNSTVGHGVKIGNRCFIGANALVTKNLPDNKVVIVESSSVFRLDSDQFLRFSKFSDI
jgi:sugar O-acyltransferase (sialic acid O-acetyltransferase NeuD family)